jgi:integrase/recombinase XerC
MCEGPGCANIVPAQTVACQQKHYFCSRACMDRFHRNKDVVGTCEVCGKPIRGQKNSKRSHRFCSAECRTVRLAEEGIGLTGPFRETIEEYLEDNGYYRKATIHGVKSSLIHFFSFAYRDLQITRLEDIAPSVVNKFITHEQNRGLASRNYLGHISTFWEWLKANERVERNNPVSKRFHRRNTSPINPRPYTKAQIDQLWSTVEQSGDVAIMLAFWIGAECGLRIGEVCNIRLSDVNLEAQTIEVRLPTKNGSPRTARFHERVAKLLPFWLSQRDPECGHDHLLHTQHSSRTHFTTGTLTGWFRKYMRNQPEPARSFVFHRLRHSWATALLNAGLELKTLKELGGWKSYTGLERYILILPDTIRRQYEQAYAKIQERQDSAPEGPVLSLLDFAKMSANAVTSATPAGA